VLRVSPFERRKLSLEMQSESEGRGTPGSITAHPGQLGRGVFILVGGLPAGAVLLVMTALVSRETRHAHNEFTSLTGANIAVPTVHDRSFSHASLRPNRLIFLEKAIFPSTSNPTR